MKTKIIAFNSPAGSGKDFVGAELEKVLREKYKKTTEKHSFKDGLYEYAHSQVKHLLTKDEFMVLCTNRILKEEPLSVLYNMSPREFLIHTSEKQAKKLYGQNVWVEYVYNKITEYRDYIIITDMGFQNEYDYLAENGYDVIVIQLQRGSKNDFSGDSRNFVTAEKIINIDNNRHIKEVILEIIEKI